jgi:hypothetical protein
VLSVNGTRNYFAVALRGGYDSLDSHTSASDPSDADSADGRFQWSLALTVLCGLASSDNAKVRSGLSQERGLHHSFSMMPPLALILHNLILGALSLKMRVLVEWLCVVNYLLIVGSDSSSNSRSHVFISTSESESEYSPNSFRDLLDGDLLVRL